MFFAIIKDASPCSFVFRSLDFLILRFANKLYQLLKIDCFLWSSMQRFACKTSASISNFLMPALKFSRPFLSFIAPDKLIWFHPSALITKPQI